MWLSTKHLKLALIVKHVIHAIQGRFIDEAIKDAGFEITSWGWKGYFQYQNN
jgi:hypothetical protein